MSVGDAEVPSVYKAQIQNTGPSTDTFRIMLPTAPPGYTLQSSVPEITVPPGQTAEVGICLRPINAIGAPGTSVPFDVTVTSTTNAAVTAIDSETFVTPDVHGVTLTPDPTFTSASPGSSVPVELTITAAGNVAENVTLSADLPTGVTLSGLPANVSLAQGETKTFPLTLNVSSGAALNTTLTTTITATFGPASPQQTSTAPIAVQIVAASAKTAIDAALAAANVGRPGLGNTLNALASALTALSQDPSNELLQSRVVALLQSLINQLNAPVLTPFIADLMAIKNAIDSGDPAEIQNALNSASSVIGNLENVLSTPSAFPFEAALQPNSAVALPNTPTRFDLFLQNTGEQTATYNLSLSALPGGVSGGLNRTSVTLAPGEAIPHDGGPNVEVVLTQSTQELLAFDFAVTVSLASAPDITRTAYGAFTVREELVEVVSVKATPAFTDPGGQVNVSARILNAANQNRRALISYAVKDTNGQAVFTTTPQQIDLTVLASLDTFDLGALNTTGFSVGDHTIDVTVADLNGQPIPGATGQGSLLIGSPISASMSVTPETLPPGDGTVEVSLDIDSLSPLPGPQIRLLSLTDTNAIASSLALKDNLAYVCGTEDVTIFDITDPEQPQIVDTFADDLINGAFTAKCRIVDNHLVVMWQVGSNAASLPILVFDLIDPLAPTLIANVSQNRRFINSLFFKGRIAFAGMSTVTSSLLGNLRDQFGDFVAFDLSDFANPRFLDAIFNPENPPDGGDFIVSQGTAVNDSLAFVATTTSTGVALPGVGRLLTVDISQPSNLSIVNELQVPGTGHLTGIATQGNLALAVGNTGLVATQRDANGNFPLTGTVTLTTLDLANPQSPQIIQTLTTTATTIRTTTVNALGNGFFAVSSTKLNGQDVLMVVDTNNPQAVTFTTLAVSAMLQESSVVGNILFAPSSAGLGIYDIGDVVGTRLSTQVQAPKNTGVTLELDSFNIEPTQIINGSDFDTFVWERSLVAGRSGETYTWRMGVNDLQPGEAKEVTLKTTVDFTVPSGDSEQIELPPLIVASEQILALLPASRTVKPGEVASYTLTVKNPTASSVTYNLSVQGIPGAWADLVSSVNVPAQGVTELALTLQSDEDATPSENGFVVTANADTGARAFVHGALTLEGIPGGGGPGNIGEDVESPAFGVVLGLTPSQATAGQGTAAVFILRVTNVGSEEDTYTLSGSFPSGFTGEFAESQVTVLPGLGNYRDVQLTVTPPPGASVGSHAFTVRATSTQNASVQDDAAGSVNVVSQGVNVAITPSTGGPTTTFQMTVKNTGQSQDIFALQLGGPVGVSATLGASSVTLAPGASQTVPITLGSLNFALSGGLELIGVAMSQANTAVKDQDSAQVTIGASKGLSVSITPAVVELPMPGDAAFLVQVDNTGNGEDAYTAEISGTTGPVTAALSGLNRQPTQKIDTFRLPGLSTGGILLNTTLTAQGEGNITVQVRSQTDASLTAQAVATVKTKGTEPPVTLDPFFCYRTKSTKGDFCAADAPKHVGKACDTEEDCGGYSATDDDDEETDFCAPNKFPRGLELTLEDPFEAGVFALRKPTNLCNPAEVDDAATEDPATHLRGFQFKLTRGQCSTEAPRNVGGGCRKEENCGGKSGKTSYCAAQPRFQKQKNLTVTNVFHPEGELHVDLLRPDRLVTPASKSHTKPLPPPDPATHIVDPYKCYRVRITPRTPKFPKDLQARVVDQFDQEKLYDLKRPTRVCTPVEVDDSVVKDADTSLMCYQVRPTPKVCALAAPRNAGDACRQEEDCGGKWKKTHFCQAQPKYEKVKGLFVSTELLPEQVDALKEDELCVPSTISAAP